MSSKDVSKNKTVVLEQTPEAKTSCQNLNSNVSHSIAPLSPEFLPPQKTKLSPFPFDKLFQSKRKIVFEDIDKPDQSLEEEWGSEEEFNCAAAKKSKVDILFKVPLPKQKKTTK